MLRLLKCAAPPALSRLDAATARQCCRLGHRHSEALRVWRHSSDAVSGSDAQALQGAGLEFIAAGGKSLDGGPGLRTIPTAEPEVAAAEQALELHEPVLSPFDEA
jgi:hypothetical protein